MKSGCLLVRRFEVLYREFLQHPKNLGVDPTPYAVPNPKLGPSDISKKYRGIDRQPLQGWTEEDLRLGFPGIETPSETEVVLAIDALECKGLADLDFLSCAHDARRVYSLLRNPEEWEIIWARDIDEQGEPPVESKLLGFEPTFFIGDHFSAICDCMCFPRWHGTDIEGILFKQFFDKLNECALFESCQDAQEFLGFYLAQDWTERGDFLIAEVRSIAP